LILEDEYKFGSQSKLIREYLEEIAELKHLVIRQEEEINYYEKKNKNSIKCRLSLSAQKQFYQGKERRL
jgi:hypothetical protein